MPAARRVAWVGICVISLLTILCAEIFMRNFSDDDDRNLHHDSLRVHAVLDSQSSSPAFNERSGRGDASAPSGPSSADSSPAQLPGDGALIHGPVEATHSTPLWTSRSPSPTGVPASYHPNNIGSSPTPTPHFAPHKSKKPQSPEMWERLRCLTLQGEHWKHWPTPPSKLPWLILSMTTSDMEYTYSAASCTRKCYAQTHGYTYVVEPHIERMARFQKGHGAYHPTYAKIKLLQKYIDRTEWLVWMDSDTIVVNHSLPLSTFTSSGRDLILSDHSHLLNNGVFFMRSTDWTRDFLNVWANLSSSEDWSFTDNGSMLAAILQMISRSMDKTYHEGQPPECETKAVRSGDPAACFTRVMKEWGLTPLERRYSVEHVEFRAFTALLHSPATGRYHRDGCPPKWTGGWSIYSWYMEGDFIIHAKKMRRYIEEILKSPFPLGRCPGE